MRNRALDSTTSSTPSPSPAPVAPDDSWFWFITEKGLRASGAANMKSTAASLRAMAAELEQAAKRLAQEVPAPPNGAEKAPVRDLRIGKVCYRYRKEQQVPDLRRGGRWLERAGFDLGQRYQVTVRDGQLTIHAEQAHKV